MIIYIQKYNDEFFFDGCYYADCGARKAKYRIIYFENIHEVPANKNVAVIGNIKETSEFFKRLKIEVPKALNAFELLKDSGLIKRNYYQTTLKEFYNNGKGPKFIKPLNNHKAFASGVIKNIKSLPILLSDYKDDWNIEILVSDVIDVQSEYRIFVNNLKYDSLHKIIGMKHYLGDEFLIPNKDYVLKVIDYLSTIKDLPCCYTLDVGILADGSTQVIELNDAWSIGSYGLNGEEYLEFILHRWIDIIK